MLTLITMSLLSSVFAMTPEEAKKLDYAKESHRKAEISWEIGQEGLDRIWQDCVQIRTELAPEILGTFTARFVRYQNRMGFTMAVETKSAFPDRILTLSEHNTVLVKSVRRKHFNTEAALEGRRLTARIRELEAREAAARELAARKLFVLAHERLFAVKVMTDSYNQMIASRAYMRAVYEKARVPWDNQALPSTVNPQIRWGEKIISWEVSRPLSEFVECFPELFYHFE